LNAKFDLIGQTFGQLLVVERAGSEKSRRQWLCQCSCGEKILVVTDKLLTGRTKNCRACGHENKGRRKRSKLIGRRFERLIVLSLHHVTNRRTHWLCQCECGKQTVVAGSQLSSGRTKSCGCYRLDRVRLAEGESSFNALYGDYRNNAEDRGLQFNLTKDEFRNLTKRDCFYCGIAPEQKMSGKDFFGSYIYNGIDRLDSQKNYDIDNCVPACWNCNVGKMEEVESMTRNRMVVSGGKLAVKCTR